jgi:peptidyl-prolyl cis-trans isomerase C
VTIDDNRGGEMKRRIMKGIVRLIIFAIALAGLSCANRTAVKNETAIEPPEHEKTAVEYLKRIEVSKGVVAARVNGADITMYDLMNKMNEIAPRYIRSVRDRSPEIDEKVRKEALDAVIFRELAVQEAVRQGMKVRSETTDHAIERLKKAAGSEDVFKTNLAVAGKTEESFRKEIERDLLFDMIVDKEVFQKITIDEKRVREAYANEKDRFVRPAIFSVDDVVVVKGRDDGATMERAKAVLTLIREKGNDPWKLVQDGTFIVRTGMMNSKEYPALYSAVSKLEEGDLSDVVSEEDGLHIVKVRSKLPPEQMTFEEARRFIEGDLKMSLADTRRREWEVEMKKNAKIEILPAANMKDEAGKPGNE